MYQPKRFAISLSAISLYPSAISLSDDVRSRRRDRTAVPPARGAAVCPRGTPSASRQMEMRRPTSRALPHVRDTGVTH